jgi:hypothetical protein
MAEQTNGTAAAKESPAPKKGANEPAVAADDTETPEVVTAPVLVVAPPEKEAPPPASPESKAPEPSAKVKVMMVNANHGARFPGDIVTVDAEYGARLMANGEAFPAPS